MRSGKSVFRIFHAARQVRLQSSFGVTPLPLNAQAVCPTCPPHPGPLSSTDTRTDKAHAQKHLSTLCSSSFPPLAEKQLTTHIAAAELTFSFHSSFLLGHKVDGYFGQCLVLSHHRGLQCANLQSGSMYSQYVQSVRTVSTYSQHYSISTVHTVSIDGQRCTVNAVVSTTQSAVYSQLYTVSTVQSAHTAWHCM